jgi:hypothetical protein
MLGNTLVDLESPNPGHVALKVGLLCVYLDA